jgi:putative transcriptional regulator
MWYNEKIGMGKLYKELKKGFDEMIAHREGKVTLRSEHIEIPSPPAIYSAKEIRKIREKSGYSQAVFAKVLNVSVKTVQAWESGDRIPSHAALRLLEIIDKGIYRPKILTKAA